MKKKALERNMRAIDEKTIDLSWTHYNFCLTKEGKHCKAIIHLLFEYKKIVLFLTSLLCLNT